MKMLLGVVLFLFSVPAIAGAYWQYGCPNLNSGSTCYLISSGNLGEFFDDSVDDEIPPNRPSPGTGLILSTSTDNVKKMKTAISSMTGMAYGTVNNMVTVMRSAASGAGYNTFTATLSGDSGSLTFTMNMSTGAWGIQGAPSNSPGSHDGNGGKVRIP